MEANATVVHELHDKGIISGGDKNEITLNPDPTQKNHILYYALKQKCTDKALMDACDIIIAVKGNQKMTALAEAMKNALVESKCMCVVFSACLYVSCVYVICWLHVCLCMCVCVHARY